MRLTEEQFNILEVLASLPRVGVSGVAGTGKTLVANGARTPSRDGAPTFLLQALDRLPTERFDAVSVDEAQAFHEYWWITVERLLRRPNDDVLRVFFDPQQNIYGGSAWEALGLRTAPLSFNCRNTQRFARYAYGLVDAEPKLRPGTPEGRQHSEAIGSQYALRALRGRRVRAQNAFSEGSS